MQSGSSAVPAAPARLLFDRLLGRPGRDPPVTLADSIARELADLLNTRLPLPMHALEGRSRSTLDYGLPDLSGFPMGSVEAREQLARHLERAILAFEPRLASPRVSVVADTGPDAMLAEIAGTIGREAAQFRVRLARRDAELLDAG